jgi:hypothetical protein
MRFWWCCCIVRVALATSWAANFVAKKCRVGTHIRSTPLADAKLNVGYCIANSGPCASGKLVVFSTWMPAWWSPSNGVTVAGQLAATAAFGSANQIPMW